MIVPEFWAEGRVQHKVPGRQITVKRFGWSDVSEEDAQSQADARAHDALQRILSGDKLARREPKVSYNGADGIPIREEVISRHGDTVITRNIYGALCLNTPDVLFVDVDFLEGPPNSLTFVLSTSLILLCTAYAIHHGHLGVFVGGIFLSVLLGVMLSHVLFFVYQRLQGGPSSLALRRIHAFSAHHPDWNLHLYQTPAGYRVLALHDVFSPDSPLVTDCFKKLRADPVYVRMCQRQHCFRARVSPKPWRIGIPQKIKPRPGVWPVNPARLPERHQWIRAYESKSITHASCQFLQRLGSTQAHPKAESVRALHDELSRAHSGLPIA